MKTDDIEFYCISLTSKISLYHVSGYNICDVKIKRLYNREAFVFILLRVDVTDSKNN